MPLNVGPKGPTPVARTSFAAPLLTEKAPASALRFRVKRRPLHNRENRLKIGHYAPPRPMAAVMLEKWPGVVFDAPGRKNRRPRVTKSRGSRDELADFFVRRNSGGEGFGEGFGAFDEVAFLFLVLLVGAGIHVVWPGFKSLIAGEFLI